MSVLSSYFLTCPVVCKYVCTLYPSISIVSHVDPFDILQHKFNDIQLFASLQVIGEHSPNWPSEAIPSALACDSVVALEAAELWRAKRRCTGSRASIDAAECSAAENASEVTCDGSRAARRRSISAKGGRRIDSKLRHSFSRTAISAPQPGGIGSRSDPAATPATTSAGL